MLLSIVNVSETTTLPEVQVPLSGEFGLRLLLLAGAICRKHDTIRPISGKPLAGWLPKKSPFELYPTIAVSNP